MNIWEVLDNKNSSQWMKSSIVRALNSSPEDSLREAALLHQILAERVELLQSTFHETERDRLVMWQAY